MEGINSLPSNGQHSGTIGFRATPRMLTLTYKTADGTGHRVQHNAKVGGSIESVSLDRRRLNLSCPRCGAPVLTIHCPTGMVRNASFVGAAMVWRTAVNRSTNAGGSACGSHNATYLTAGPDRARYSRSTAPLREERGVAFVNFWLALHSKHTADESEVARQSNARVVD